MTNDVKEQTEETNTGGSSVEAQQDKADAAAVAPVNAASEPKEAPAYESAASGEFDFGAILEQFEQEQTVFHSGELVEGKVVGVSEHGVLVDAGKVHAEARQLAQKPGAGTGSGCPGS